MKVNPWLITYDVSCFLGSLPNAASSSHHASVSKEGTMLMMLMNKISISDFPEDRSWPESFDLPRGSYR